jgi:hypothetical protein
MATAGSRLVPEAPPQPGMHGWRAVVRLRSRRDVILIIYPPVDTVATSKDAEPGRLL